MDIIKAQIESVEINPDIGTPIFGPISPEELRKIEGDTFAAGMHVDANVVIDNKIAKFSYFDLEQSMLDNPDNDYVDFIADDNLDLIEPDSAEARRDKILNEFDDNHVFIRIPYDEIKRVQKEAHDLRDKNRPNLGGLGLK